MIRKIPIVIFVILATSCYLLGITPDFAQYVNPLVGTSNGGNTHPGALLPFGMVSVSPFSSYNPVDNHITGPRASSAYIYGQKFFSGFTHTNLSGVGCPDLGTFVVMATSGELRTNPAQYAVFYTDEIAKAGYYSIKMPAYGIKAEVTATLRSGLERFTFQKGEANILINVGMSVTEMQGASVHLVSSTEVEGYKEVGNFCGTGKKSRVYFVARINKVPKRYGVWNEKEEKDQYSRPLDGNDVGAYFSFQVDEGEEILVQLGVSYTGTENARHNLNKEQTAFDFSATYNQAYNAWNKELSRIEVEGGNEKYKCMFYTGIYHILTHPNILSDADGTYPAYESSEIKSNTQQDRYSVFSLWDTYRNVHPFLSLVYPERQSAIVKTMIEMYRESGHLPKWELYGTETFVMVGDPAVIVLSDTYLRGIRDFDVALSYQAMCAGANNIKPNNPLRPGYSDFVTLGYIPEPFGGDKSNVWGSVSTGLEYCMADYALSQMAEALGEKRDSKIFAQRADNYQNYYDSNVGFMRPKHRDGKWMENFNPMPMNPDWHSRPGFVEGCSWHYNFFVPFDIKGMIKLTGGNRAFVTKLNNCFEKGYFNMGNEPDIAYPYLFTYIKGAEHYTQSLVRSCIDTYFGDDQMGITGNDDCGTMSAWLVFSMMGLYPDAPGCMNYRLTTPIFDKITIHLNPNYYPGRTFLIDAGDNAHKSIYIDDIKLNNRKTGYSISHSKLVEGGVIKYILKK